MISCALIYFIIAFIRLLLVSVRFSNLQQRYIAMVQIQQTGVFDVEAKLLWMMKIMKQALIIASEYLNNIKNEIQLRL